MLHENEGFLLINILKLLAGSDMHRSIERAQRSLILVKLSVYQ